MLARSKLNRTESEISEARIINEIGHEDFMTIINEEKNMTIINEEKNYRELKKYIRMMKSQRTDTEKSNLIEEGKKIGLDEIIKHNEIIINSLKSQI